MRLALAVILLGCSTSASPAAVNDAGTAAEVEVDAAPKAACDAPVTAPVGLDPFYKKSLDGNGVAIVSSDKVSDQALRVACRITTTMVSRRDDVRLQMVAHKARVAVMARTEVTTDIPEHADLYTAAPGTDWNKRVRGLGGTVDRPATSCAEENILCDATDVYRGENILVHELAHGIYNLGIVFADKTFASRLKSAFNEAIAAGKWKNTYAATNMDEYFAEGVQSYFETNIESIPSNGIHNEINTRKELEGYDPKLYALVAEAFRPDPWTPGCP
jgi:hypothetical protein